MRILTCDEVCQAEQEATGRPGMSTLVLARRAGYAVAQFCLAHFKFTSVCVVCGPGGNGARGLAAAECLQGITNQVSVILLAKEAGELCPDADAMFSRLAIEPIWIGDDDAFDSASVQEALQADLILDAITDAGSNTPLSAIAGRAVQALNDALGTVVAVDAPSGADLDSASPVHERRDDLVFAHGIITFIAPRPAHVFGELTDGPIAVSEIGVQPALVPNQTGLEAITGQEAGIAFPPWTAGVHSRHLGHVLVIGGSKAKPGAVSLAGMAVLRAGAGLVTVACPESIWPTVAGFAPEFALEGLPETATGTISLKAADQIDALLEGKQVVVVGPGVSRNPETGEFIRQLLTRCPVPLVLDDDGVDALVGHLDVFVRSGPAPLRVLIATIEDAGRLMNIATGQVIDGLEVARSIARKIGSCVVLKGYRTVVAGVSGETWINLSGKSAVAKAGCGDVLAGMIGAALVRTAANLIQGQETSEAVSKMHRDAALISAYLQDIRVAAAVHLCGLAADHACGLLHENSVLGSDLLSAIPEAFGECERQRDSRVFYLQT
ncbi:MAG TPA: NAD(P)H-hydrate dehydratase [Candidatus Angelobacter sp.]|jgi:NAD(P)H-hydrate epimerase|nr:NAD(P)H-hydrate dehydratase [Candidatus Angelobacter sp.]